GREGGDATGRPARTAPGGRGFGRAGGGGRVPGTGVRPGLGEGADARGGPTSGGAGRHQGSRRTAARRAAAAALSRVLADPRHCPSVGRGGVGPAPRVCPGSRGVSLGAAPGRRLSSPRFAATRPPPPSP